MRAREPKPIVMSKAHPSTTIDIYSRLLSFKHAYPEVIPTLVSGELSIVIKSETSFSVTPCSRVPTSLEATNSLDMARSSTVHLQEKRKLALSKFCPVEQSVSGNWNNSGCGDLELEVRVLIPFFQECQKNCSEGVHWESDSRLLIDCSSMGLPPPTFVSPWAYRRYVVHLAFAPNKYPRQELKLRIPVQVNY